MEKSDRKKELRHGITEEEKDHQELEKAFKDLNVSVAPPPPPVQNLEVVYPESYRINSSEEIRVLTIAENFQRQYAHLFPDRKPLLLYPVNECGVKKFVCTTVQTGLIVSLDLYDWQSSASFVADYLSLDLLEPPFNLPRYLFSSTSVLQRQRATCFEFATLLCSLLIARRYDAYCVSGYADKDMCLLDKSHEDYPLPGMKVKTQETKEYEFKSQFLEQQQKKKEKAEAALLEKQKQQKDIERQLADPLRGLRVHCWVLVLAGSNGVQENFFIDPLTGASYNTAHHNFLGIESVWNNLNYYVNMQECRGGCTDMVYDLEDLSMWEPVLGPTCKVQLTHRQRQQMLMRHDKELERKLWMPRPWVHDIMISDKDMETRWPGGQKVTRYRNAKLEMFAPNLMPEGLVKRLTTYKAPEYTEVVMVKEWYQHEKNY